MKKGMSAVFACVGAMVGAGFASGREVVAFFSRFGLFSWHLIVLASLTVVWLGRLCMRGGKNWTALLEKKKWIVLCAACGLMIITSGAMISAAGHMVALLWPNEWAYASGAVATLLLAWVTGGKSVRVLGWISGILSILLTFVLIFALRQPVTETAFLPNEFDFGIFLRAGLSALGYASMNMLLSIGVVSRCKDCGSWVPWGIGGVFGVLLGLSNLLYLRHPQLHSAGLPLLAFLNRLGRRGFLIGVLLLYLSVFTTLASVLCGLKSALEQWFERASGIAAAALGFPLLLSCAGFSGIVDHMYGPAGLVCFLTVFVPIQYKRSKQYLTFTR